MVELESIKEYEVTGKLVLDERARGEWCQLSYPNYPNGCPNYGKKPECPPNSKHVKTVFNLNEKHWFIVAEFDLKKQSDRMRASNPNWTEKQCRNSRLWQSSVHKKIRDEIYALIERKIGFHYVYTLEPEAMGIHVIKTAKNLGIPIKTTLKDTIFKIGLVGYPKNRPKTLDTLFN